MRVQKLEVIFILVAFSVITAFSEEASKRKSSEEFFRQNSVEPVRLAQNSAADDALTEALRQKQIELDAAENAAKGSPAPKPPAKVEKPVVVKPKPVAKPVVVEPKPRVEPVREVPVVVAPKPVVAQPSISTGSDDALSEALRQKQAELDAQEAAREPRSAPAAKIEKPAKVQKPVEVAKPAKVVKPVPPAKTRAMEKAEAKEREESEKRIKKIEAELVAKEEALQKKMAKAAATSAFADAEATRESQKKAAAVNAALQAKADSKPAAANAKSKKEQPVQVAPVELSGKEARLAELLRKYKADEITPHDYHLERAKILSEP